MADTPRISKKPTKPTGSTGPFSFENGELRTHKVSFPSTKDEIELKIANLFIENAGKMPIGLAPFSDLVQNAECDLDFTVKAYGTSYKLELAEFAPLDRLQASYKNAPDNLTLGQLADLAISLIAKKSSRQGGARHLLLLYKTDAKFFIPPPAHELIRRHLNGSQIRFDAVYFLSPHDQSNASVFEIWPGRPHPWFASKDDKELRAIGIHRFIPPY